MNKRQKKKLENRAGFFHYRDYKLRVRMLYHVMNAVVMKSSAAYAFKLFMFNHFKGLLLHQDPKKRYPRKYRASDFPRWVNAIKEVDTSHYLREHDHPVSSNVIPSMSMRMVGDKIHSFSIDEDSFKNGYKPGELAVPLPKGPLDGHKSWAAMFPRKYPDVNWPPEGTTVETTISDDGDTQVDVIKREGEPDLTITHMGLNADEPDPVVLSESAAEELSRRLENATCVVDLDNAEEPLVIVEGKGPDVQTTKGDIDKLLKYRGHVAEDFIKGGSAIEYPSSATIDLRKDEDISGPIHLGPIDLGPTDGERIEEHLLQSEDKKRRFASNACEASAND